jgi:hypothetical protein
MGEIQVTRPILKTSLLAFPRIAYPRTENVSCLSLRQSCILQAEEAAKKLTVLPRTNSNKVFFEL